MGELRRTTETGRCGNVNFSLPHTVGVHVCGNTCTTLMCYLQGRTWLQLCGDLADPVRKVLRFLPHRTRWPTLREARYNSGFLLGIFVRGGKCRVAPAVGGHGNCGARSLGQGFFQEGAGGGIYPPLKLYIYSGNWLARLYLCSNFWLARAALEVPGPAHTYYYKTCCLARTAQLELLNTPNWNHRP